MTASEGDAAPLPGGRPRLLDARTELRYLKGVGPRRADALRESGLETVEDLLYVLPFRWEDRRAFRRVAGLGAGDAEATLDVRVVRSRLIRTRRPGFTIFEAVLADASGSIRAIWYNQPYLERVLAEGRRAVVFGRPSLDRYGRDVVLENPDYETLDDEDSEGIHTGRIVPVYRKLGGLSSRVQRNLIWRALETIEGPLAETVPADAASREESPNAGAPAAAPRTTRPVRRKANMMASDMLPVWS
mgnify:CR=1 FL=1